jgi:hypothetical protein
MLADKNRGGGVVFATGTPISNTMAEMFTMQRYLQMGALRRNGLQHFDSWAGTFGETVTTLELRPDGADYPLQSRFARFVNVPELMQQFGRSRMCRRRTCSNCRFQSSTKAGQSRCRAAARHEREAMGVGHELHAKRLCASGKAILRWRD